MPTPVEAARRLETLQARYRRLCAALARLEPIKKGSLYQTYTHCGSPGCRCHRDPEARHGPYWYWTGRVAGKNLCRQVTGRTLQLYRRYAANYQALKETLRLLEQLSDEILACQLALTDVPAPPKPPRTRRKPADRATRPMT